MASWGLLDEREENELHKTRLLNVEERLFKRISKRVKTIVAPDAETQAQLKAMSPSQRKSALEMDFAAFNSNITRLQFLHDANQRERERYNADQERILAECQAVRDNNNKLREQLEDAKAQLAQRKKLDELADKITSNRLLRPREDQLVNLAKLEDECRELERESSTYSETWKERQNQFNRIMEEGMLLRRLIRDEKEEVERREGMDDGEEEDGAAGTPRNEPTPHPDGAESQAKSGDGATTSVAGTPAASTPLPESMLRPLPANVSTLSRSGSQAPSPGASPMPVADEPKGDAEEDVDMEDSGLSARGGDEERDTPRTAADTQEAGGNSMEVDE